MGITRGDVLRIFGEVDDATVEQILSLDPSESELREVIGWLEGDEAMEAQLREPSSPTVRRIVAWLQAIEEDDPDADPVLS